MEELLKFTVASLTDNELAIKVKNPSGETLDKTLVIKLCPPSFMVSKELDNAGDEAAKSQQPPGAVSLKGIVAGPDGWSVWARCETADSAAIIVFMNDLDDANQVKTPVQFPAGAEFTIRIPLDPTVKNISTDLLYSYKHGKDPNKDLVHGSLSIQSEKIDWTPHVSLITPDTASPTAVPPGNFVTVGWSIKDGVSATLRGPLPGGNSELTLSSDSDSKFKISGGSFRVAVATSMIFMLQAEVKGPQGQPNVQIVRMLALDTANKKHLYISPRPDKVLPYGLIEIDWAAWGVTDVTLSVSGHTNREVPLTQQSLGRFYEGSGVMRVSASHTINKVKTVRETVKISSTEQTPKERNVDVISWMSMDKTPIKGEPLGFAVSAPKIGLLTTQGLYIAHVYDTDPSPPLEKLEFSMVEPPDGGVQWHALTALGTKFVVLRRTTFDLEVAAYGHDGKPDAIPPLTLPSDLRQLLSTSKARLELVAAGKRVYVVVESPFMAGTLRRAYSVGFNDSTKRADYRQEKLLEPLLGYRLTAFDGALYALNRATGRMFRFGINSKDEIEEPRQAASAVKVEGTRRESMILDGLIVPLGRILVVLSPSSFPSVAALEQYGLKNTLNYIQATVSDRIPQDLFYNPQKDYWGRCGHDLDIKPGAVAAYRGGPSKRLWVIQPDGQLHTLAVGAENLFAHDYKPEYPTAVLTPYLTKQRMFAIKTLTQRLGPIEEKYRRLGVTEFNATEPTEAPLLPTSRGEVQFSFNLKYNEAEPGLVRLRQQMERARTQRADVDYLLEVVFDGPDLSTATSRIRRLVIAPGKFLEDEIDGSRTVHSSYSVIEIPRPPRLDESYTLVLVNSSRNFRLKINGWRVGPYILEQETFRFDHDVPDFTLEFEGKISTQGVIGVNLNFALCHGIEASDSSNNQTKLMRLTTDKAQKIQIVNLKVLNPGDPPLTLPGAKPIESVPRRPVYVCQLDYKM